MPNDYAFRDGRLVRARRRRSQARGRHGSQRPRHEARDGGHRSDRRRCARRSNRWSRTASPMPSTIACVSSRATESFLDTIEFGSRAAVRYVRRRRRRIDDRYAKANLYTTYSPADFLDYVNPQDWQRPGGARSVEHADGDPDAAGTGSETTGIAIFDYKKLRAKIG